MGQVQSRVIIYAIFVVHAYSMLHVHTKFQGRRSIASGEEIFYAFIIYDMGVAAMLIIWRRTFEQLFVHKGPRGCIWNFLGVGGEVVWNCG